MPIDWDKIKSAAGTPTTPSTPTTKTPKTVDWDKIAKVAEEYKLSHAASNKPTPPEEKTFSDILFAKGVFKPSTSNLTMQVGETQSFYQLMLKASAQDLTRSSNPNLSNMPEDEQDRFMMQAQLLANKKEKDYNEIITSDKPWEEKSKQITEYFQDFSSKTLEEKNRINQDIESSDNRLEAINKDLTYVKRYLAKDPWLGSPEPSYRIGEYPDLEKNKARDTYDLDYFTNLLNKEKANNKYLKESALKLQQDVIDLKGELSAPASYLNPIASATRDNPKSLVDMSDQELLFNLAKYKTEGISLLGSDLKVGAMYPFESTFNGKQLKDILNSKFNAETLLTQNETTWQNFKDMVTDANTPDEARVAEKLTINFENLQKTTLDGLNDFKANIEVNKKQYLKAINYQKDEQKKALLKAQKEGKIIDPESLKKWNAHIDELQQKYQDQFLLEKKANDIDKSYFGDYKSWVDYKENRDNKANELNLKWFNAAEDIAIPIGQTIYNSVSSIPQALKTYKDASLTGLGYMSKEQQVANQLFINYENNYDQLSYIPEPLKNKQPMELVYGEDGSINWVETKFDVRSTVREGISTLIESIMLFETGEIFGKAFLGVANKGAAGLAIKLGLESVGEVAGLEALLGKTGGKYSTKFLGEMAGIVPASQLLMEKDIKSQNMDAFLRGDIESINDVISMGELQKINEGITEMMWQPDFKLIKQFGKVEGNIIRDFAIKKLFQKAVGKSLIPAEGRFLLDMIGKHILQTPVHEGIEEVAGNKGTDIINQQYSKRNLSYNPEKQFTFNNNVETFFNTAITMFPTIFGGIASQSYGLAKALPSMNYDLGAYADHMLPYAKEFIYSDKVSDKELKKLLPQYTNRDQIWNQVLQTSKDLKKSFGDASPITSKLLKDSDKHKYFELVHSFNELTKTPESIEANADKILAVEEKMNVYKKKVSDREELLKTNMAKALSKELPEKIKELDLESNNLPTLQAVAEELETYLDILGTDKKYDEQRELIKKHISDIETRITSLAVQAEDLANPEKKFAEEAEVNNAKKSITFERETGPVNIKFGKRYVMSKQIVLSAGGSQITERPTIIINKDNGDGTLEVLKNGKLENIPIEDLADFRFTTTDEIDKWRKDKDPRAFMFDQENTVFTYSFYKETKNRVKEPRGRLRYDPETKKVSFVYLDNNGEEQSYPLSKELIIDFMDGKKTYLSVARILQTPEQAAETEAKYQERQAKIKEAGRLMDLSKIQSQTSRRLQFLNDYLDSIVENLINKEEEVEKAKKELEALDKEIKSLSEALDKKETKTKKGTVRVDVRKLLTTLNDLQNTHRKLEDTLAELQSQKEDIDREIVYIEQYKKKEFDSETSIVDQFIDDWVDLGEHRDALEKTVFSLTELSTHIKSVIGNVIKLVNKLVDGFKNVYGKDTLLSFDHNQISELLAIDKLITSQYPDLTSFLQRNPEYLKNLNKFNDLVNNNLDKLEGLEKELDNIRKSITANMSLVNTTNDNIRYQEKLINEAQKKEQEYTSENNLQRLSNLAKDIFKDQDNNQTNNEVGDNETDLESTPKEGAKIPLTDLFSSTTSGAEENTLNLGVPAVKRLQNFLNTVEDPQAYNLLIITKDNAKKYGLEGILYTSTSIKNDNDEEANNDIKYVLVKIDASNKVIFIDENGNELTTPDKDNVVYTSMRTASLTYANGEKRYFYKGDPTKEEELANKLSEAHSKNRQDVINTIKSGSDMVTEITFVSRGRVVENGQPNAVSDAIDLGGVDLTNKQIIQIPVPSEPGSPTGRIIYFGTQSIAMPIGRPVISHQQQFGFLDTMKFNSTHGEKYLKIFMKIYNDYKNGVKLDPALFSFIEKTLYFRNPEKVSKTTQTAQTSAPGRSQVWMSKGEDGIIYLNLSSDYKIPFVLEKGNLKALDSIRAYFIGKGEKGIYHNVDAKNMVGKQFTEIVDIKGNEIVKREWNSYQEYLISNTYPDGTKREVEDIPLTIKRNPSTELQPNVGGRYIVYENKINDGIVKAYNTVQPTKVETPAPVVSNPPQASSEIIYTETPVSNNKSDLKDDTIYKVIVPSTDGNRYFTISFNRAKKTIELLGTNSPIPNDKIKSFFKDVFFGNVNFQDTTTIVQLTPNKPVAAQFSNTFSELLGDATKEEAPETNTPNLNNIMSEISLPSQVIPIYTQDSTNTTNTNEAANNVLFNEDEKESTPKTGTEILKKINTDIPSDTDTDTDNNKVNTKDYRLAHKTNYKLENLVKAKEWLAERLPNVKFSTVFGLIDGKAWGVVRDASIILSNLAEEGTVYHEAFEIVHKYFLNNRKLTNLRKEFRSREGFFIDHQTKKKVNYKDATIHQIKEQLAEEYREYALSDGTKLWKGEKIKKSLFRQMLSWVKDFILRPETIESVFKKISEGKYKDRVPVIDTNDINKDYKISDLQRTNPVLYNDLMKSMTFLMTDMMEKENKSIPEILLNESYDLRAEQEVVKGKLDAFYGGNSLRILAESYNKESFISAFSSPNEITELFTTVKRFAPAMISNYKLVVGINSTAEQKLGKLYDVLYTYNYLASNWEDVKKDHIKYLKKYSIEITTEEDDEEINIDDQDSQTNQSEIRDILKISRKLNASTEIKLLISMLREQEYIDDLADTPQFGRVLKAAKDRETRFSINNLMMSNLVDYNKTIINLLYKFAPATTFDEMADILKKEALVNASLLPLISKLKLVGSPVLTKYDVDLRNKFFVTFNNMEIATNKTILNTDLTGSLVNINKLESVNQLKNIWFNNMKSNNDVFIITEEGTNIELSNLGVTSIKNLDNALTMFNALGIDFSFNAKVMSKDDKEKLLKSAIDLFRILSTNEPDVVFYNSAIAGPTLTSIATLHNKYNDNYKEPQHLNIEGEPVQNIILQNFVGYIFKAFNNSPTLSSLVNMIPQLNPAANNNAWLSYSQVLGENTLFFKDGKRIKELALEIVDGAEAKDGKQGKPTSDLSLSDRFLQEFSYNLSGIYYVLTPADTKTEWAIKFGNFVNRVQASNDAYILDIFRKYLKAEIETARQGNPGNLKELSKKNNKLRFFADILTSVDLDIKSTKTTDQLIEENLEAINKDILAFINNSTKKTKQTLKDYNLILPYKPKEEVDAQGFTPIKSGESKEAYIIPFISSEFVGEGLDTKELDDLIRFNDINYIFNIMEQYKVLYGDPAQWKDPTKRVKSFVSGRTSLVHSAQYFNDFNNQANNNLSYLTEEGVETTVTLKPGDFGYSFYDDTIKTQTYIGPVILSPQYETILKALRNSVSQDLFQKDYSKLTNEVDRAKVNELIEADKYESVEEADGQAIALPNGYKEIRQRSNSWTDADEEQKQWDDALCRQEKLTGVDYYTKKSINNITIENLYPKGEKGTKLKVRDIQILEKGNPFLIRSKEGQKTGIINVYKPIYSGFKDTTSAIQNLDKMSIAPINWRIARGTNSQDFYIEHYKKNTTYIKMDSANKVGQINSQTELYNKDGKPNTDVKHEFLLFKYFGLQVETIAQKTKSTLGTQLTKLATLNLISNGVPIDFIRKQKKNNINITKEEVQDAWDKLTPEQKLAQSQLYKYIRRNTDLLKYMKIMAKDKIFKDFGVEQTIVNGESVISFTNFEKFAELINRELESRDTAENLKKAVQLDPTTGKFYLHFDTVIGSEKLESLLTSIIDKNILRPKLFGGQMPQISSALFEKNPRIYKKNFKGKEVLVSNDLKFYSNEKGKQYCEVYLPFYMKEFIEQGQELSINDIPENLRFGIGFRIPTQEGNSLEHFKIKEFLPVEYGNAIVVPSEITTKAGSDFDIDKLSIYLYNYIINKKTGKPEKIEYSSGKSKEDVEGRYSSFIKSKIKDYFDIKKEVKKDSIEFKETQKELEKNFKEYQEELLSIRSETILPIKQALDDINTKIQNNIDVSQDIYMQGYEIFKSLPIGIKQQFYDRNENIDELVNSGTESAFNKTILFKEFANQWLELLKDKDLVVEYNSRKTNETKTQVIDSKQTTKILNALVKNYDLYLNTIGWTKETIDNFNDNLKALKENNEDYRNLKIDLKEDWLKTPNLEILNKFDVLFNNTLAETFNLTSFDEFSALPIELQNTKKALENAYIDNLRDILQTEDMFAELVRPNSADVLKDLAGVIRDLYGKAGVKKSDHYLYRTNNSAERHAFLVGKDGVGIGASQQTQHALSQIIGLKLKGLVEDLPKFNFPTNSSIKDGVITYYMGEKSDAEGRKISNVISSFIDAFVDIAKDSYIFDINGNLETAGIYIAGLRMGMPINSLVRWFNQPIIRDYIFELQKNKSILIEAQDAKRYNKEIVAKVEDKYLSMIGSSKIKQDTTEYVKQGNYTDTQLDKYIKEYVERDDTEIANAKVDETAPESLTKGVSLEFVQAQLDLLSQFRDLQKIQSDLLAFGQAINLDTSRTVSFESIRLKMAKINKALQGNFSDSVKDIFEQTFIGTIYDIKRDFLKSIKPLYLTEQDWARQALDPILNGIYNTIGKNKDLEKIARDIKKQFISYLLHTIPLKLGDSNKPVTLSAYVNELILNPETNISKRIRKAQIAQKEDKISQNIFVKSLLGLIPGVINKKGAQLHNVQLLRKVTDKIDNDMMVADFFNLGLNPMTQRLMADLIKTTLLQNGINSDPVTFSSLIPNEAYLDIIKQVDEYIKDNTMQTIVNGFKSSYYSNQWWNKTLVPESSKTTSTIDKQTGKLKSRKVRNWIEGNDFLEFFVYSDSIPGPFFREARNPYLTWTTTVKNIEGGEKYSSRAKEEMAKKGDYSFLETRLFKRLEVYNTDTKEMDIPLGVKGDRRYVLYYPVDKKGERFKLLEHSATLTASQIYPPERPANPEVIFNLLKSGENPKFTGDFLYQHVFPNMTPTTENFIDAVDKQLSQPRVKKIKPTTTTKPSTSVSTDNNTKTPIEGLNERLNAYGNAKLVLPIDFYEGGRPEGRLNAFKAIIEKVADNFQVLKDVKWDEFTFLTENDKVKLDALRPKVAEFSKLNITEITLNRTVAVEKRYAQLTNEIINEFVDIVGKHVEQQLGKKITTTQPSTTKSKINQNKPDGLPPIGRTPENCP